MKAAILGGGSFGTSLAISLNRQENQVKIWEFIKTQAEEMNRTRICPMLPDVIIPENIMISNNLEEVINDSEMMLIVVPSDKVEQTIITAKEYIRGQKIIICSKGFGDDQTYLSEVVSKHLNNDIYCLYGPTLAKELAQGEITGMVLAGNLGCETLKNDLESETLKIETTNDIIGTQTGAALKNVVTIFVGIAEGLNMGENTRAYIFTKGIAEIKKIGLAMGAEEETFLGLTCVGDLTLNSRNRKLGIEIGKGRKLEEVLKESNHVSEGVIAIKNAVKLAERLDLNIPLIQGLYAILFDNADPREIIKAI